MLEIGDKVSLKIGLKAGSKYGGLILDKNKLFSGEQAVVWRNTQGLVELSNCYYYTEEMLIFKRR
ncbi:MAG: hypothetical protein Q4D26_11440 [Clostridia bacterium]|nr:hypothetical protein [Clostridia bacterium]